MADFTPAAAAAPNTIFRQNKGPIHHGNWLLFPRQGKNPVFHYFILEATFCSDEMKKRRRIQIVKRMLEYSENYKHWRMMHISELKDLPYPLMKLVMDEYYIQHQFVPYKTFAIIQVPDYYHSEFEDYMQLYCNDTTGLDITELYHLTDDPQFYSFFQINFHHYFNQN